MIDQVTTAVVTAGVALTAADGAVTPARRTELLTLAQQRLTAAATALAVPLDQVPDPTRERAGALLVKAATAVRATIACQGASAASSCRDAGVVAAQVEDARAAGVAVAGLRQYGTMSDADVTTLVTTERARLLAPAPVRRTVR